MLALVAAVGCDELPSSPGVSSPGVSADGNRPVYAKTFDDLKFDIEPGDAFDPMMLTDEALALDGEQIRIRGYILPGAHERFEEFVLVRDNLECCFGPGAALYDCVLVRMSPGKTAEFSVKSVEVTGEFAVREFPGPDGNPWAIYQMTGEAVE